MKIENILIALSFVMLAASCEDFLDERPQSDFTKEDTQTSELESAYKSVDEAKAELNGVYALFKADIYEACNFYAGDCMSDNCYIGGDGVAEEQFDNINLSATNAQVATMWSQYYAILGSATNVIENVKLMDSSLIDNATRASLIADAKFARAWVLFDIVRYWGAAPMSLELIPSITVDNIDKWYPIMYPERSSEEDIYAQILDDLSEESIANLPSYNRGVFRGSKGGAYALLAKVYATMGAKAERDYGKVVEYCEKVRDEGYSLLDDFDQLWTVSGKFSRESIFEMYFSDAAEQHNWAYWILLSDISGSVVVSWRRYCTPSHDLVAKFDKEKDVRYASSIYWTSVPYDTYYPAKNYPLAYKIRQKENDIILLRLADVLLLEAEALVELDRVPEAIELVSEVRTRAHVDELPKTMSVADARLAVENEGQLEPALEGHRWFDLVRNDRMEEVMQKAHDKDGNLRFSEIPQWRRKLPIPQDQIDINERLSQNEGY